MTIWGTRPPWDPREGPLTPTQIADNERHREYDRMEAAIDARYEAAMVPYHQGQKHIYQALPAWASRVRTAFASGVSVEEALAIADIQGLR